jgi:hypothetical protein
MTTWTPPEDAEKLTSMSKSSRLIYERAILTSAKDLLLNEADRLMWKEPFLNAAHHKKPTLEVADQAFDHISADKEWSTVLFEDCVGTVHCDPEQMTKWIQDTFRLLLGRMCLYELLVRTSRRCFKGEWGDIDEEPFVNGGEDSCTHTEILLNENTRRSALRETVVGRCKQLYKLLWIGDYEGELADKDGDDEEEEDEEDEEGEEGEGEDPSSDDEIEGSDGSDEQEENGEESDESDEDQGEEGGEDAEQDSDSDEEDGSGKEDDAEDAPKLSKDEIEECKQMFKRPRKD